MKKIFFAIIVFYSCTQKETLPPSPVLPVPDNAQLAWHNMELNAFVHFTINTFTDKEWGYGDEGEKIFNPTECNPIQWASVLKEAGFKGLILTCKHHDGFCLWPSQFTEHSVKNSPWKNGQGDLVKEVAEACKQAGLKFGIYLSPWDRNHKDYGSPAYIKYYRNQLKELFEKYPDVFEMWFDGANGGDGFYGGKRETRNIDGKNYYDWPATLSMVKKIDTGVIFFSDAGPSVRWAGNEKGIAGETNWNTLTPDTLYAGKPGIEKLLNEGNENGSHWIPQECDVSIRPGWFYHANEDSLVKTPEQLFDIYLKSAGRGSLMLLNIPPDRRGLFHENDIESLRGFRKLLDEKFKTDQALHASASAKYYRGGSERYSAKNLVDGNDETYWATDDDQPIGSFEIDFRKNVNVNYVILKEYIKLGQRIKHFSIDVWKEGQWQNTANGTTIGHKRILKIDPVTTNKIKIEILDSKACPVISAVEVY
ncbi:MAG: alpha-L-fucosidase [Cytophagales bacterium]|jgi:alpha-L-fucosidase|nr:alpha-L-fucosidase [Bacteroidota bacterium]MBS1980552.1 alpha-L-fucosidase [Bacteroidota bacterium]WHZ07873.1 MAG: alpha-L-fucosidase [Cytophagales bacterium]